MNNEKLDIRCFGAVGDGKTDDTAAIQRALDAAAGVQGTLRVPAGTYACGTLKMPARVGMVGDPTWTYRNFGGSILRLTDPKARCLLDLTGAIGATVNGICLDGGSLGSGVHGILVDKPDYGSEEDNPRVERCRVAKFTGDGVRLERIWCFSVRHCMLAFNKGCGLRVRGWDGFILDNWFSGNGDAGYGAYDENASVTMTGNRIEWNAGGGVRILGGSHYNITGNYIDRSGAGGIGLLLRGSQCCQVISITGNVVYRSGRPEWQPLGTPENAHMIFRGVEGLTCVGNTLNSGRDDGGKGGWSPSYGIVCGGLSHSVVKDNVLFRGAMEQLVVDQGGHGENVVLRDNLGSLRAPG